MAPLCKRAFVPGRCCGFAFTVKAWGYASLAAVSAEWARELRLLHPDTDPFVASVPGHLLGCNEGQWCFAAFFPTPVRSDDLLRRCADLVRALGADASYDNAFLDGNGNVGDLAYFRSFLKSFPVGFPSPVDPELVTWHGGPPWTACDALMATYS